MGVSSVDHNLFQEWSWDKNIVKLIKKKQRATCVWTTEILNASKKIHAIQDRRIFERKKELKSNIDINLKILWALKYLSDTIDMYKTKICIFYQSDTTNTQSYSFVGICKMLL